MNEAREEDEVEDADEKSVPAHVIKLAIGLLGSGPQILAVVRIRVARTVARFREAGRLGVRLLPGRFFVRLHGPQVWTQPFL